MAGVIVPGWRPKVPTNPYDSEEARRRRQADLDAAWRSKTEGGPIGPPPAPVPPSMNNLRGGGYGGSPTAPQPPASLVPPPPSQQDIQRRVDEQAAERRRVAEDQQRLRDERAYQDKVRGETNTRDDAKRREILDRIDREMSGGGGGGAAAPASATSAAPVATEQDARAAAFSRAKDQAGRIARSSLTAIAEQVAGRGMSGGGIEALRQAGAIGTADDTLQDLTRDQMISDVNRAGNVADRNYAGDLTRRGQDMQNRQSYLSLLRGLY